MPQVITACLNRSPLKLTPCEVIRDYTYVEDMAGIIVALALAPGIKTEEIINVGSGQGVILRDFVLSVARLFDGEALMRFGELVPRSTEMESLVADVQRLRDTIGDAPRTSVAEGVRRTVRRLTLKSCR
jgi:nucleoside-diphosphate-sugar epimerase